MRSEEDNKKIDLIVKEFKNNDVTSVLHGGFVIGIIDRNHHYLLTQDIENEANMRAYTKIANFLDELPKKEKTDSTYSKYARTIWSRMYDLGWNDCIDAILKEVDWEKEQL